MPLSCHHYKRQGWAKREFWWRKIFSKAFETNFRAGFQLGRSSMAFCEKLPHLLHLGLIAPEWLSLFPDQKGFTHPASEDTKNYFKLFINKTYITYNIQNIIVSSKPGSNFTAAKLWLGSDAQRRPSLINWLQILLSNHSVWDTRAPFFLGIS